MARARSGVWVRCALAAGCVIAVVPKQIWAWGCEGHRTVARIAAQHLSVHAAQQVHALLTANPIDPKLARFCEPRDADAFVDAATWADDIRAKLGKTAAWHFLNVPRGAPRNQVGAACPSKACVTGALAEQTKVLGSHASAAERTAALRYIIHFAGDIHQPLHCTTNDDRGGNCVPVRYFNTRPALDKDKNGKPIPGKYRPNLHGVWDTSIIATDLKVRGISLQQLAKELDTRFSSQIATWMAADVQLDDWAWDSHEEAERLAYGKLPHAVPVEADTAPATCDQANHVAERMRKLDLRLDQTYQDAALPVMHEQLAKAGARLANILNRIWP